MMINSLDRGVFIYHSSMTEPFGELALHLQDCCGGCPYCVECCQRVVDEANEITRRHEGKWSRYMREEGYKEYSYLQDCGTLPSIRESTYVDISRGWLRDFMRWLYRRYIQRVPD